VPQVIPAARYRCARMPRWFVPAALVCALIVAVAGPLSGSASAAGLAPAVADCNAHASLTHHYTVQQLEQALATMPADIKEYSACYNIIDHQLLVQLGKVHGSGGSGGGGGSFLPTWLIVVLVVLLVGGAAFGAMALRRRGEDED
jgi:hypothetical protein